MEKNKRWAISDISVYRGVLMGAATFLVVFRHMSFDFDSILNNYGEAGFIFGSILQLLRDFASFGVDIFLFLSGFGLYYSFSKNSSLKNYYKKRFTKIVLPFLAVSAFFYMLEAKNKSAFSFFIDATRIRFFLTGDRMMWFFMLIIVLYLVFPLFYKIISKFKAKGMLLSVIAVILLNTALFLFARDVYKNNEIALCKIPSFIVGIYAGLLSKSQKTFPISFVRLSYFISLAGLAAYYFLINTNYENFSFILYYDMELTAVSVIIMLSDIFRKFNLKGVKVFLTWLGSYSLEIYLFYENFLILFSQMKIKSFLPATFSLIIFIFTLAISVLFKLLIREIESKIKTIKEEF